MTAFLTQGAPRLRTRRVPIEEAILVADPACPSCGGVWMRELLMRHDPNSCELLAAEDARLAADLNTPVIYGACTRPATETEVVLATTLGLVSIGMAADVHVVKLTPHVRKRATIGGIDLNRLCTADELEDARARAEKRALR